MAKNRVSIVIGATAKGVKGVFRRITNGLGGIKNAVFSIQGLLAGGGLALLGKSFIDAASTTENFKTRLKILLGSAEAGNQVFKDMAEYAGRVPFEYEQVMASATALAGVMKGGGKEIREWMPMIGDLAAASGLSIQESTDQIIRMYSAGAGAADLFRERGVLAMLGFEAGVSYSAEETRKKLMSAWNDPKSKFKGATEEMADDWTGLISMLKDGWFSFRTAVMENGAFEYIKSVLQVIVDKIAEAKKTGDFKKWADETGKAIVTGFKFLITSIPQALLIILEIISKIAMGISGWKILWTEAKIHAMGFAIVVQQAMQLFIAAHRQVLSLTNVGGMFDGPLKLMDAFVDNQKKILGKLRSDRNSAITEQAQNVQSMDKEQAELDKYKEQIDSVSKSVEGFLTDVDKRIASQKKATETTEKETTAMQKLNTQYKELAKNQRLVSQTRGSVDLNDVDGFSYGDINAQVDQAEKTQ